MRSGLTEEPSSCGDDGKGEHQYSWCRKLSLCCLFLLHPIIKIAEISADLFPIFNRMDREAG